MTNLAATATQAAATHSDDMTAAVWLILIGSIWAAGYAFACWIWPFTNCRRCHGSGKRPSPTGRAFRHCGRCTGSGARLRIGRVLWIHMRNEYNRRPRNHR